MKFFGSTKKDTKKNQQAEAETRTDVGGRPANVQQQQQQQQAN